MNTSSAYTIECKPFDDIRKMSYQEAREYLINLRKNFSMPTITKHWNDMAKDELFYLSKVYKIFHEYNVPINTEKTIMANTARMSTYKQRNKNANVTNIKYGQQPMEQATQLEQLIDATKKVNKSKFVINLDGKFDAKELSEKLDSIGKLLSKDKNYKVNVTIEEVE